MRIALRMALVATAVLVTVFAVPAAAGTTSLGDFLINPVTGYAGTVITMQSINPCPSGAGVMNTYVGISTVPDPTDDQLIDAAPTASDGSWSIDITVPASQPIGDITYYAECKGEFVGSGTVPPGLLVMGKYNPQTFTVLAPPPTTASTTTTIPATTTTQATTTTTEPAPAITVSPAQVQVGATVRLTSTGWMPGSSVDAEMHSTPVAIGTFVATPAGDISTDFTVGTGTELGLHVVQLTGTGTNGQAQVLTASLTVVAAQATTTTVAVGALPTTGTSTTRPLVIIAMVMVGVGAGVVLVARRRRTATEG